MRQFFGVAALAAVAGMSWSATAQDSVSNLGGGLPGDALNPWFEGCAAYVVDLAPIVTSGGHVFGVAPVLKTSRMSDANFNALGSSVAISPDIRQSVPFSLGSYKFWDTPGQGVNIELNDPTQSVMPTGNTTRFAVMMSEFGTTDNNNSYNGAVGAVINYKPTEPNRLYVDRRVLAVNIPNDSTNHNSQLAGASIDADGNAYYRADGFNPDGFPVPGPNILTGNNIYRTRLTDRNCQSINMISALPGALDATDWIIRTNSTAHTVPANVPASVVGGDGLYVGPNFSSQYVFGPAFGSTTATIGHLDPVATSLDHRGSFGTGKSLPMGGVYTLAVLGQSPAPAEDSTVINIWGVDGTGAVVNKKGFQVPLSVTDNDDAFALNYAVGYQDAHHYGSTSFRGGVGHVAVGRDGAGNNLIAMTMTELGVSPSDPSNQIVVGRFTDPNGPIEWTFAAWIDLNGDVAPSVYGKQIFDSMGNAIGQLVELPSVTGGSPFGPSLSAPAMDAAGNIWFIGAVELYDRLTDGSSDFDGALIRAVYDEASFSYRLELVLETGSVVLGSNSGLDYRIDFLGTATNTSSASPSSMWSSAVADGAWNNVSTANLDPSDPMTSGGAVIQTGITYDVNGDGRFNNPTSVNFDPNFPEDESYQVALYVGYYQDAPPPCVPDLAAPFGVLNFFDIQAFVALFNAQSPSADLAAPFGTWNFFDIQAYVTLFNQGCP